ncbi:MAG: hypothetical protein J6U46_00150 [Bacteroidaceae bacterium]|nr:hypothetical protein [Bacteroidaceae bacterium]
MKRQFITPSVFCVKLDPKRAFLQSSYEVSDDKIISKEDEDTDAGWAREDNNDNYRGTSIWDNAW